MDNVRVNLKEKKSKTTNWEATRNKIEFWRSFVRASSSATPTEERKEELENTFNHN